MYAGLLAAVKSFPTFYFSLLIEKQAMFSS